MGVASMYILLPKYSKGLLLARTVAVKGNGYNNVVKNMLCFIKHGFLPDTGHLAALFIDLSDGSDQNCARSLRGARIAR